MPESNDMSGITSAASSLGSVVSLYSGAGGLDLGFSQAGFEILWANDIDEHAVETHNKLFGHDAAIAGDIRAIRRLLPRAGDVDLVIGGPPCQGFSVAGRMDPNDPRSRHVWDFLGVVRDLAPTVFVMENVKALAVNRRWSQLRNELFAQAMRLGYHVQLLLLNAAHFGVPQARERMFLIGSKSSTPIIPLPTSSEQPPTVRSVLESLPPYGSPGNDTLCAARVTPAKTPVLRRSPFAGMLFNGQGRPIDLDRPAPTLPASMGGNRTPIVDQRQLDAGEPCWVVEYHKHLWEGGDPVDHVPERLRRLTVEEAAALQTFPPGMHWAGRQSAQYRQIGNAVPPKLAYHVAKAVARSLNGVEVGRPAGFASMELLSSRA